MQDGLKAGLAILIAVFLTGFLGFLTTVSPVDVEKTTYDRVADLTPVVSAYPVDSYSEYYPVSNVSGWIDSEGVTIPWMPDDVASAYPYKYWDSSETTVYSSSSAVVGGTGSQMGVAIDPELATFWPVGTPTVLGSEQGDTFSSNGMTVTRIADGGVQIRNNGNFSQSLSIYIGRMSGDGSLLYGFAYTFLEGGTEEVVSENINTVTAFYNKQSSITSIQSNAYVDISITAPLAYSQYYFVGIMGYQSPLSSSHYVDFGHDGEVVRNHDPHQESDLVFVGGVNSTIETGWGRINLVFDYQLDNVALSTSATPYVAIPISAFRSATDTGFVDESFFKIPTTVTVARGDVTYGFSSQHGVGAIIYEDKVTGRFTTALSGAEYLVYNEDNDCWYKGVLSDNGRYYKADESTPPIPSENLYFICQGWDTLFSVEVAHPIFTYKYVNANEFVTIGNGITAKWRNTTDIVGAEYPYQNGLVRFLTDTGTMVTSLDVMWKSLNGQITYGNLSTVVPSDIPFDMALVTLDFINGEFYVQGIVPTVLPADTSNYTVQPYRYPLDIYFFQDISGTLTETDVSPSYIESLILYKSGGTKAFVTETWVQLDPMGLLWGDPSIYTSYWFPDRFSTIDGNLVPKGDGLRILFNSFVAYGDSFTINGVTMTVSDGKGTFTYGGETKSVTLKGMAVDFRDGHVYVVEADRKATTYDFGAYSQTTVPVIINGTDTTKTDIEGYTIDGTGSWYWYANLYTINDTVTTEMQIDLSKGLAGWEMSLQTTVLLYLGMLIVSVAGVVYFTRDSDPFGLLDWIIIGMVIIGLFSVMSL